MDININEAIVAPSINAVKLTNKQIFPKSADIYIENGVTITSNGVAKNTIKFDREEDMIVMCLSTFVHDYVHDYNLGSMATRVIKGNIGEGGLFASLGINVGNNIFKIISYPIGGHRDVSMYNDEQFVDKPAQEGSDKSKFSNYLKTYEENILTTGGDAAKINNTVENLIKQATELEEQVEVAKSVNQLEETKPVEDSTLIEKENPIEVNPVNNATQLKEEEVKPLAEGLKIDEPVNNSLPIKSTTYDDVASDLSLPIDLDFGKIVRIFEQNADFLDFQSALNTYVVTYLGYDINAKNKEFVFSDTNKNKVADEAIRLSFEYIKDDFEKSNQSIYLQFYGDMFKILNDSYDIITEQTNKDLSNSPFDILNSTRVLYQFIIFYITYITVSDYNSFKKLIGAKLIGGDDTNDSNEGNDTNDSNKGDNHDEKMDIKREDNVLSPNLYSSMPQVQKERIEIPEYVYLTHNNLLTTITRGMFIKLGIYRKIFLSDKDVSEITPEDYKFGPKEINKITYEKLIELYPINPEEPNGHRNNELLILEILILKRLLVEMSPTKTLTFGAKIDDDLKNYMDTFYYDYFIDKQVNINDVIDIKLEQEIEDNPDILGTADEEAEELFAMCDEDCQDDENNYSAESKTSMLGGNKDGESIYGDIEMTELHKPTEVVEEPVIEEPVVEEPVADIVEEPVVDIVETNIAKETIIPTEKPNLDRNIDIIEQPKPTPKPILFNKLLKMYQNNIFTVSQLKNSKIKPIIVNGNEVNNMYDLLHLNETLIERTGSRLSIPAPKYKFIINNAANVGSNINGSRMFIPRLYLKQIETIINEIQEKVFGDSGDSGEPNNSHLENLANETKNSLAEHDKTLKDYIDKIKILNSRKRNKEITISEYNDLLELNYKQKELDRKEIIPLQNKLFLLETIISDKQFYDNFVKNYKQWFQDSQPVFGLFRSLQRGIFCPTSSMMDAMDNCSLKYKTTEPKEVGTTYSEIIYEKDDIKISFGGVVLNYNISGPNGDELTAKINYNLVCNNPLNNQNNDTVNIPTLDIKVSESNDLKARVAYKGVINMINTIYMSTPDLPEDIKVEGGLNYIKQMWKNMQYQYDQAGFNMLLSATAIKTMGDYLQECQACFKWGGYVSTPELFPIKDQPLFKSIKDKLIYRSVSEPARIVPYDNDGNALRLGIQGDRPSGFRSIYMLLNGEGAVNDQTITGYMFTSSTQNPSRSLLVSRNEGKVNPVTGLKGNVVYGTRELQITNKEELLKSLEFLTVKEKSRNIEGSPVVAELTEPTIEGSEDISGPVLIQNSLSKIEPLKNISYEKWIDYKDDTFIPTQSSVDVEQDMTDAEEERKKRLEERQSNKELTLKAKAEKEQEEKKKREEEKAKKITKREEEAVIKKEETRRKKEEATKIANAEKALKNMIPGKGKKVISTEFLNTLISDSAKLEENGISQDIFQKIYDKTQEEENILRAKQETKSAKSAKASSSSAERKAKEANNIDLMHKFEQEDRTKENGLFSQIDNLQDEIKALQKENETLILTEKRGSPILNNIKQQISLKEQQINILNRQIEDAAGIIRGGYTKSNRKQYKNKLTKREYRIKYKLTKKHKIMKKPRNTRKLY